MIARLLSVNAGLPREIAWRGRTVRTAIWKVPVQGKCMVRRLNVDGDGQGIRWRLTSGISWQFGRASPMPG